MTNLVSAIVARLSFAITFARVQRLIGAMTFATIVFTNIIANFLVFRVLTYSRDDYFSARQEGLFYGWAWILFHPVEYVVMWIYSIPFGPARGLYGIPTWFMLSLGMLFAVRRMFCAEQEYNFTVAIYQGLIPIAWKARLWAVGMACHFSLFPQILASRVGQRLFSGKLWVRRNVHRFGLFVRYDLTLITVPTRIVAAGGFMLAPVVYLGTSHALVFLWVTLIVAIVAVEFAERYRARNLLLKEIFAT